MEKTSVKPVAATRWGLAALILLASVLAAVLLWSESRSHQREVSEALANDLLRIVQFELAEMGYTQTLLARRWSARNGLSETEFRAESLVHISARGFRSLSYVNPDKIVQWVEPLAGNEAVQGLDNKREARRSALLDTAQQEQQPRVGQPIRLIQGGTGLLVAVPIGEGSRFQGWITGVLDLSVWLEDKVKPRLIEELGFSDRHSLWANDLLISGQGSASDTLLAESALDSGDITLRVRTQGLLVEPAQWLAPLLVLLSGLVLAVTVAKLQTQFLRTRGLLEQAEHARRRLADEVAERAAMEVVLSEGQQRAELQRNAIAGLAVDPVLHGGDFPAACEKLVGVLSQVINVSRAGIWLFSDDGRDFDCISLFDRETGTSSSGLSLPVADYPRYFQAIRSDSRIYAADAQNDPRTSEFTEGYLKPLGISAMLDAGIVLAGKPAGVICLEHRGSIRHWQPDEEAFASLIASLVAQLLGEQVVQRAESAADRVGNLLQHVLDAASQVSVIATDLEGVISVFNRGAENLTGYSASEMVGKQTPAPLHLPAEVVARGEALTLELGYPVQGFDVFVARARANTDAYEEREWTYVRKDGDHVRVSLNVTAIRDATGQLVGFLGIATDITERYQARLALEAKNRDLVQSNARAQAALAAADAANEAKSAFLASMSHEIRTPMNGVLGMLTLLGRQPLNEAQTHYFNLASSSARALLSIIDDILDFSKMDSGKLLLEEMDFDLVDLISDIVASQAQRAEEKQLAMVLDMVAVNARWVRGDPGRLRQIVTNLLTNALKFTEQGRIHLQFVLTPDARGYQLQGAVTDTGIGIEKPVQSKLFSAFSQADESTTRRYGGTGLGLVICRELCELMGGGITLESEPGQGSCFRFSVALHTSTAQPDAAQPLTGDWLVVCPDAEMTGVLVKQLCAWGLHASGCPSLTGFHGDTQSFDGILLDSDLPEERNGVPVPHGRRVLMAPVSHSGAVPEGFEAFVRKPVTPRALRALFYPGEKQLQSTDAAWCSLSLNGRHLLLVEDNPVNQQVVLGLLEGLGCQVSLAENGQQALDLLREQGPGIELVLMDCRMPVMDGYQATRKLRSWGGDFALLPVVALTANALAGDKELCLAAGMNDHLAKPINPKLLMHKLQQWLSPNASNASTASDPVESEVIDQCEAQAGGSQTHWLQADALARVRGKPERLVLLIELFLRDMPERLDTLAAATAIPERDQVQALAHQIKGVAGNLSAQRVAALAAEIESAAGDASAAGLENLHQQLAAAFAEVQVEMLAFVAANQSGAP